MSTPIDDIDQLLRESAPRVSVPSGAGPAVAATARSVVRGAGARERRVRFLRARTVLVTGAASLCLAGTAVVGQLGGGDSAGPSAGPSAPPEATADHLSLVAETFAPDGLPLPPGVTMEDATALVARTLQADPGLQEKGDFVLDRGVVRAAEKATTLPAQMQRSGATVAYVAYAYCQWERAFLAGEVTELEATSALGIVSDRLAFVDDGDGVRRLEGHEGISAVPDSRASVRAEYRTHCTNGFGTAPEGDR